jgi:hypothetical protein
VNVTEPRQTYIRSNTDLEEKLAVVGLWRAEKPEGRRGGWKEERLVPHLLGGLQNIEKEEECSDIGKKEGSGDSKSQTPIERRGGNSKNRKAAENLRIAQNERGLDLDAISECLRTDHRIIEGTKIASENGDFDLTKWAEPLPSAGSPDEMK